MPIYEYSCPDCGHDFEALQKFSDDPIRDCPSCKAGNVRKRISQTSFVLQGSGWYKDHYGLKSASSASSAESKPAAATESKPAASTTPTPPAAK